MFHKNYYTLYSLSALSLAKSVQLILQISTTYRLVSYLLADNWLICRLRAVAHNEWFPTSSAKCVLCEAVHVVIFLKTVYNKTIFWIWFLWCPSTAISRTVVGKNVHATIPKGNTGYDQYTVPDDCSCRTYFCCFPLALANICPWPPVPFFQISLKNRALKTTHNTVKTRV